METTIKKNVMAMLRDHLEMLEIELKETCASFGEATLDRNNSNDDYSVYFQKKDLCTINRAKVSLMKEIIENVSRICNADVTQMVKL